MRAYEAIIKILQNENIDTVFTLLSEENQHLISEIQQTDADIRVVHTRHEQGAVAMADGYSRVNDTIGVAIVGRGPAVAQTATGLGTARKRGSNLLVLVPEPTFAATNDVKQFEQEAFLKTTIGNVVSIRSENLLIPELQHAFRLLRANNGPVAVQVSMDLLNDELKAPGESIAENAGSSMDRPSTLCPDESRINEAVDIFLDSDVKRPPVILAGRGATHPEAVTALGDLAEHTSAFLTTTLQGRGLFSEHPFSVGFVGTWGSNLANEFLNRSDCIFAVGCSLNDFTTDSGSLIRDEAKIIHIDTDATSLGRYTPVDIGLHGDAAQTTTALVRELDRRQINRDGELWTEKKRERIKNQSPWSESDFSSAEGKVDPRALMQALDRLLPDNRVVIGDGGHHMRWVLDGLSIEHPHQYIWTIDFGSIGLGVPIGIGRAVGSEDEVCVTVCGDGGFMMALQEIDTAVRHEVPIIFVVMNDGALGEEYHNLAKAGRNTESTLIPSPDLAGVARKLGAAGHTVGSIEEIDALGDELGKKPAGPVVIDCKIDGDVVHPRHKLSITP